MNKKTYAILPRISGRQLSKIGRQLLQKKVTHLSRTFRLESLFDVQSDKFNSLHPLQKHK
jgi:hypothetical protein